MDLCTKIVIFGKISSSRLNTEAIAKLSLLELFEIHNRFWIKLNFKMVSLPQVEQIKKMDFNKIILIFLKLKTLTQK